MTWVEKNFSKFKDNTKLVNVLSQSFLPYIIVCLFLYVSACVFVYVCMYVMCVCVCVRACVCSVCVCVYCEAA